MKDYPHNDAYRPDIDGLRAFAVLAVVIFHAFPGALKGGFIGVDIFFVISGYLISGIILRDLREGVFTFRHFYARRIRRIFPALTVVLASAMLFGYLALLPDEYESLGRHVCGGAAFVANLVLWGEAGYFDAAARAKPLLHLWSLGIEEQFYIFFPLLLWCCAKRHLRPAAVILFLGFLSFCDNLYVRGIDSTQLFYSPLTRVWELLAGAALIAVMRQSSARAAWFRLDALCGRLLRDAPQENDGRT